MARPRGQFTVPHRAPHPRSLQGKTFKSYSAYETERAHREGFSSIRAKQYIHRLEHYDVLRETFRKIVRGVDEAEFNRAYQKLLRAERRNDQMAIIEARAEMAAALTTDPSKDKAYYLSQMMKEVKDAEDEDVEEDEIEDEE